MTWSATFGILLFVFTLVVALARSAVFKRVTLLDWALVALGGLYGVGGFLVSVLTEAGENPLWEHWLSNQGALQFHSIAAFIMICFIWFGWHVVPSSRNTSKEHAWLSKNGSYRMANMRLLEKSETIGWVFLLLAFVTQFGYTYSYGGFVGALDFSRLVRAGHDTPSNPLSFLKPFGSFAFLSAYIFFALTLSQSRRKWLHILGFILGTAASVYIMVSWLGRLTMVLFPFTLVLIVLIGSHRNALRVLITGMVSVVAALISLHAISQLFSIKATASIPAFLARELSAPFVSFVAAFELPGFEPRWFYDVLVAPAFLLPESLWMRWIDNIGSLNTTLIVGAPKGEAGVTGSIPMDLLTLGFWQGGVLGIVGVGLLFGIALRVLQRFLDRLPSSLLRTTAQSISIVYLIVRAVYYSEPAHFMSSNLTVLLFLLALQLRFAPRKRGAPVRYVQSGQL